MRAIATAILGFSSGITLGVLVETLAPGALGPREGVDPAVAAAIIGIVFTLCVTATVALAVVDTE